MSKDDGKHITIRCKLELRVAIRALAKKRGTNVSQLTLDYYRKLLEEETKQEAEQA